MLVNFYFTLLFDKFLKRVLFDKTVFFSKLKKKKKSKKFYYCFLITISESETWHVRDSTHR